MMSNDNTTFRNTFNHKRLKGTIKKKRVKVRNMLIGGCACVCVCVCVCVKLLQSCPTLCNPVDRSLPGPSVHGILQA